MNQIEEYVVASTRAQGVPLKIEDADVLAAVALMLAD